MLKRPLFISFLFLALGIITGVYLLEYWILIGTLVFILTCVSLFLHMPGKPSLLFIIFYLIGFFGVTNSLQTKNYYIQFYAEQGNSFIIDGEITSLNLTRTGRTRLILNATRFETSERVFYENIRISAILPLENFNYEPYKINSDSNFQSKSFKVSLGANIRLFGSLSIPQPPSTPGGFNSFIFSRSRGIHYTIFPREFNILGQSNNFWFQEFLNGIRERIIVVFNESLPDPHAGLLRSMVLGDRTSIDDETIEAYRAAGIYHILIVSGLHISLLMVAVYKFFQRLFSKNIAAFSSFIFILLYGTMIGFSISVVRAILMAGVFITAEIIHRERDLLTTTAFSSICMLIYEPLQLFDIGFQLSFGAVFGIALFHRPLEKAFLWLMLRVGLKPTKFKKLQESLTIDIAITLALTPIFAFHFYRINPYSLFGNLLITASSTIVIILGFLLAIVGLILEPLAIFLAGGLYFLLSFHIAIAMFFYNMPGAFLLVGSPSLIFIAIYYTFLLAIIYIKNKKITISVSLLAFIAFFFIRDTRPVISFMDVGHGKSTIIRYSGNTIVIDGGGTFSRPIGNSTGVNILVPYLEYNGISHIDKIFLTHQDRDHIVGIIELMSYKSIGVIYTTFGLDREAYLANIFLERANYYGIEVNFIYGLRRFSIDGLFIDVLYPLSDTYFRRINQTALVMRVVYGNTSFFLASDIDKEAEQEILKSGVLINSDVLQVAHQGSRNSSHKYFLQAVNPSIAIISAGRGNIYGHPHAETLERLYSLNIPVYKTMNKGTITFRTDGETIY
ncbi:MAG: DNA internalization-related competence protein ComEC/Rec2 [Defluviitaleaceae bacterium]|nr:DNA internalization-related competence protein ComEC/Rec2 [Defluviitaleaceae bacterium]